MSTIPNPDDFIGWSQLPNGGFGPSPYQSSGGASGSWGDPVPTNITVKPTPTTAPLTKTYSNSPRPQPTQQPSNDGFSMDAYKGWDETAARADWAAKGKPNLTMGVNTSYDNALNDLYSSTLGALDKSIEMYKGQAGEALKGVDEQAASSRSAYDEALRLAKEGLATQNKGLGTEYQDMASQNLRSYNALNQQAQTRYGGASSTGGAIQELVRQEFMRTQGGLRQKYMAGVAAIQSAERNAQTQFSLAVQELEKSIIAAQREINTNLETAINNVNLQKAQAEDDKRAARSDALARSLQQQQQLAANREDKLYQLATWKMQVDAEAGKATDYLDSLVKEVTSQNFSSQLQANYLNPASYVSNPDVSNYTAMRPQTRSTDEFGNLIT